MVIAIGCHSRSVGSDPRDGGSAPPDAAVPDAYVPSGELCEGVSQIERDDERVAPVPMTTGLVAMGCCDGAYVDVHAPSLYEDPITLWIQAYGGWEAGQWELPGDDLVVGVLSTGGLLDPPEQQLSGWLRLEHSGEPSQEPGRLSFCLTVDRAEPSLQGIRMHGADLPLMPWSWVDRLTLSLPQDAELTAAEAATRDLDELALRPPLLHLDSLRYYVWSEHRFVLDPALASSIDREVGQPGVHGVPFVVTVDEQRLYLGAFMSPESSAPFDGPTIVLPSDRDHHYTIEPRYPDGPAPAPDPRADPDLRALLEEAGKLAP